MVPDPILQADMLKAMGYLGSWQVDYTTHRIRAEGGVARAYGLGPERVLDGVTIDLLEQAFFPDDFHFIQERRARFRQGAPGRPSRFRFRLRHPCGTGSLMVESCQMLLLDQAGQPKEAFGTLIDVTGLDAPEAAPAVSRAMAEAADVLGRLRLPPAEALPKIDKLAADLVAVCRDARAIGLAGLEADLKPALARVSRALSHGFRRAVHH